MRVNTVLDWVKAHPLYAGLGAAALILLLFASLNGFSGAIETYRANRFDKQQQAHEKEVTDLKAQREAAIKRGDDAEAQALLVKAENDKLKDLINQKGGQIEKAANELEQKLNEAKKGAGDCQALTDPVARTACVCNKLKSAGFECN